MSFVSQRSLFLFLLPPFPTTIKTTFSPYKTTFRFLPTPTTMQNFFIIFSLLLFLGVTIVEAQQEGKAVVQQQQLWCVAKNNAEDTALQQALDWACGPGGANCGPIQNSGPCYDPNDLIDMATYAFNDYCLKHGMSDETCNFSNTAALTALDPSNFFFFLIFFSLFIYIYIVLRTSCILFFGIKSLFLIYLEFSGHDKCKYTSR